MTTPPDADTAQPGRVKLDKRNVDALTCPSGRKDALFFDTALTGFCLRVTSAGAKVFLLQYREGNRVLRLKIGRYGDITPAEARRLAEEGRGSIAAGRSPVAERRARVESDAAVASARQRQVQAESITFAHVTDSWERLGLASKSTRYASEAVRALRLNLATLATRPAAGIEAGEARALLEAMVEARGPSMARRTHAYARAMFAWAQRRQMVPANPFAAIALDGREVSRDRVLSDTELGEVWRAAGRLGWPYGPYLRFLLLTMQREAETAGLRWAELAPDLATWQLPAERAKNNRQHIVHLVGAAGSILREVPRVDVPAVGRKPAEPSPLVFTTTGRSPVSGFAKAKARLDAEMVKERATAAAAGADPAPLIPWRLHDFRRTGVTTLARLGVRWEVADRMLNHVTGAITGVGAIYQRHDFLAERQAASVLWADHVLKVGQPLPEQPAAITFVRRRRRVLRT